jgi:hypothetical protein
MLSVPQRGHLMLRWMNSPSASFLLHKQQRIDFNLHVHAIASDPPCARWRCLGQKQDTSAGGGAPECSRTPWRRTVSLSHHGVPAPMV